MAQSNYRLINRATANGLVQYHDELDNFSYTMNVGACTINLMQNCWLSLFGNYYCLGSWF